MLQRAAQNNSVKHQNKRTKSIHRSHVAHISIRLKRILHFNPFIAKNNELKSRSTNCTKLLRVESYF